MRGCLEKRLERCNKNKNTQKAKPVYQTAHFVSRVVHRCRRGSVVPECALPLCTFGGNDVSLPTTSSSTTSFLTINSKQTVKINTKTVYNA